MLVAPDAGALRAALLSDAPTTLTYDAPKPPELLAEDRVIGQRPLGLDDGSVRVTPVSEVFAR